MIYTGSNEILGIKLGNTDISAIYAGDLLIYPTTVTGWSVTPTSFEVKSASGTVNIRITSLSAWTISSSESWITFSQNSGNSGRTTVIATYEENTGESNRSATITVSDGTNTTTVSFLQNKPSALPGPFMFNYNAKEYNSSTKTFPKAYGQLFDQDLVLNITPRNIGEDFVQLGNGAYMGKTYNSTSANPFNRDSSHNSFTLIYKTSGDSGNQNIVANRGSGYNYMARSTMFHTSQSGFLSLTANTDPHITLVRIYADGKSERKFLDSSGNVLQSTSASSISWGSASNAFGFFSGYGNKSTENFTANFYWMYCSLETLTDADIKKVIDYNENL